MSNNPGQFPPPAGAPVAQPPASSGNRLLLWLGLAGGAVVLLSIVAVVALLMILPTAKMPSFDPFEALGENEYVGEPDQTEPPAACEGLCFSDTDVRSLIPDERSLSYVDDIGPADYYLDGSESVGYYYDEQDELWFESGIEEVDCSFVSMWTPVWLESSSSAGVRAQRVLELGNFGDDAQTISATARVFDTVEQAESFMETLTMSVHECPEYTIPDEDSVTTYTVTELTPETTAGVATTGWIDSGYPTWTNVLHQYGNVVLMTTAVIDDEAGPVSIDEADLDLYFADSARRLGSLSIYN